jgi:biliverdin reductase
MTINVGIIGTGFVGKLRAEAISQDSRSHLVALTGHSSGKTLELATKYQAQVINSWQELVAMPELDLIIICGINQDHGLMTEAALKANKHVVVEYPLSLEPAQAAALLDLAEKQNLMLHVEHIELLGGLHQALKENISAIGTSFLARYVTINPQRPAPRKWTYSQESFGFPFSGALSRLHRLTDLFGLVESVSCQLRYWGEGEYYQACLCNAQLAFVNGTIAEVTYGKGEVFWQEARNFEIQGDRGILSFVGDTGTLIRDQGTTPLTIGSRKGLFALDTKFVLDHLTEGKPLYASSQASYYTLKVAEAARQSAITGKTIFVNNPQS